MARRIPGSAQPDDWPLLPEVPNDVAGRIVGGRRFPEGLPKGELVHIVSFGDGTFRLRLESELEHDEPAAGRATVPS